MSKHFALNSLRFFIVRLLAIFAIFSLPLAFAQNNTNFSPTATRSAEVYQVLAAEIALQRGEIGSAYQTYMSLARSTRDPRLAQRAMEIALIAKSTESSLEAAKLWDNLAPASDRTAKEVLITLLILNKQWNEVVDPASSFLKKTKVKDRDAYLQQWHTLVNKSSAADDAIPAFGKIISSLSPLSRDPEILFIYALAEEKAKRFDSMEKILRGIIKAHPNEKNALNALGYSFADRNIHLQEAFQLVNKAYKLSNGDTYILDSLAWVNFRMGKNELASTQLRQAWATQPEAEIGAHLGEVLWVMGDKDGANMIWKQAQEINGRNPTLIDTLRRLQPEWTMPGNFDHTVKRRWDGRFAFKVNGQQARQGGSGSFTLDHESLNDILELRGPLGVSLAKVNVSPAGASLEHGGRVTEAVDADTLVQQVLGMPLPARGLSAWMSGYIRPGSPGVVERDNNGLVSKITQDGWLLNYTWFSNNKLQKLLMSRQTDQGDVDIRLVFDQTDE